MPLTDANTAAHTPANTDRAGRPHPSILVIGRSFLVRGVVAASRSCSASFCWRITRRRGSLVASIDAPALMLADAVTSHGQGFP